MRRLRVLRLRLRTLFRRDVVDEELDRELGLHLEQLAREYGAAGLTEAEARRAARRDFGSPLAAAERCRDVRRVALLEDFVTDVGYAWRSMARSPIFALTAVASLALGLGAHAAVVSMAHAVLLRTLPVDRPQELVFLEVAGTEGRSGAPPYPCFERLRAESSSFAGMAAFATDHLRVEVDGIVEQVFGQVASGTYFDVLGLQPAAGRLMTAADEKLDPPVAVIGYSYWQRRFGGADSAIGKTLVYRDRAFTIVGVMPARFWGLDPGRQVDVTLPITQESRLLADAGAWWFDAVGRLRRDRPPTKAAAEADAIFQSFMIDSRQLGELRRRHFDHVELVSAARGLDGLRARFSTPLYVLLAVSSLVLLTTCVNVGNLLLARGAARDREFAIRLATGAGHGRLVRQLVTETLVLFLLGAAAGLLIAYVALHGLTAFFALGRNPIVLDVRYDAGLALSATCVALVAGLLTGSWPAVRALNTDPHTAMKEGTPALAGRRRSESAGRALLASQVALSLVLLATAVMFGRTLANLRAVDLGFRPVQVVTMSLQPALQGEEIAHRRARFWRQALGRTRVLPGVRAASLSVLTPLSGRDTGKRIRIPGFEPRSEMDRLVHVNHVSEDYFRTFGIEIRAGRAFTPRDETGGKVVLLNETAARAYFPGRSPIGEWVTFGESDQYRIVGVAGDHKHMSVREAVPRFAYVPLWQPLEGEAISRVTLAVWSGQPHAAVARAVSREVHAIHSNTLVSDVIGAEDQVNTTLVSERLLSTLGNAFALLALALAAVGLYGLQSYSVARRTAEFGLRMALGAAPSRVASEVLREVLLPVAAGLALGVPVALALAKAAETLLFGVTPGDPATYVLGAAVLSAVAALAAWLPARRASSIDPSDALRCE